MDHGQCGMTERRVGQVRMVGHAAVVRQARVVPDPSADMGQPGMIRNAGARGGAADLERALDARLGRTRVIGRGTDDELVTQVRSRSIGRAVA